MSPSVTLVPLFHAHKAHHYMWLCKILNSNRIALRGYERTFYNFGMKLQKFYFISFSVFVLLLQLSLDANSAVNSITQDMPRAHENPKKNKEIASIDLLINATEQSLEQQKIIKQLILEYQTLQAEYLQHENDADLLMRTARAGKQVLDKINECSLNHNFDPEFISELTLFSNVASKRGIPK